MIKAVLLDWGGVITDGGRGGELDERLAKHLGITPEAAWQLLKDQWAGLSRGDITEAVLWERVEQTYGQPITPAQRNIWNGWHDMQPFPEMLELVQSLQRAGKIVGVLSNVIPPTVQEIRSHGGYDSFDFTVLSCEVGAAKPEKAIYQQALRQLPGINPAEILFVDDQQRCLTPAEALGLQTVLATDLQQVLTTVQALTRD